MRDPRDVSIDDLHRKGGGWLSALLVCAVVFVGYGIAPQRPPLVGEETCRAMHGIEMAHTGDWLIATNQGVAILDRPPMQYWTLALVHRFVHALDPMTLRLTMVATTLATALIVLTYARRFMSPTGALAAAVAYPTMGHVLDLGRRAETDGLFALLLAAALLAWHRGYVSAKARAWFWIAATILAALATLTKGLQGPVAFFGATWCFLALRRNWRTLFNPAQLGMLVLFGAIVAIWQVPFFLTAGWEGTRSTWLAPGGERLGADVGTLLGHLALFPLTVLVATLPWSPLLLGLLDRRFWSRSGSDAEPMSEALRCCVLFSLVAMAAIFAPVWASSGGHHRYVMPMYPFVAVVCGAVVDRALALDLAFSLRRFWRDFARIVVCAVAVAATVLAVIALVPSMAGAKRAWLPTALAQPWWLPMALVVAAIGGAWIVFRQTGRRATPGSLVAPFVLAALTAMLYNGPYMNVVVARAENVGPEVTALRSALPPGAPMVSFGPLHHKFVYWFSDWQADPIPILPLPATADAAPDDVEYFAIAVERGQAIELPFAWEELARLNMDRTRSADPKDSVVVGRRTR